MRLTFVLGTRPEIIKLAPAITEAKKRHHSVQVILTGQHEHLAPPLLKFFNIKPTLSLARYRPHQGSGPFIANTLRSLERFRKKLKCDCLIVQGDTSSALAGALWGALQHIPVIHIEGGLRTYDFLNPFPEEIFRQMITRLAYLHFAPTPQAARFLRQEKVSHSKIFVIGNTSIDSLHQTLHSSRSLLKQQILSQTAVLNFTTRHSFILVTTHRRENRGQALENICHGLLLVVQKNPNIRIVFPIHPHTGLKGTVQRLLGSHPRVFLCEPLFYPLFIKLMQSARVILTDSGGIQEESPTLNKPVLILRKKTERMEAVRTGFSKLVGTNPRSIERATSKALEKGCQGKGKNPYGDGKAAKRFMDILEKEFSP